MLTRNRIKRESVGEVEFEQADSPEFGLHDLDQHVFEFGRIHQVVDLRDRFAVLGLEHQFGIGDRFDPFVDSVRQDRVEHQVFIQVVQRFPLSPIGRFQSAAPGIDIGSVSGDGLYGDVVYHQILGLLFRGAIFTFYGHGGSMC